MGAKRAVIAVAALAACTLCAEPQLERVDTTPYRKAMEAGWKFLVQDQAADGSWGARFPGKDGKIEYRADVGITGLTVYALAKRPAAERTKEHRQAIAKGVEFMMSRRRDDGTFADPDGMLVNYKTSIALLALADVDPEKYRPDIAKAKEAIIKGIAVNPVDIRNRGGAGYVPGEKGKDADLNNTAFALEALKRAEELGIQVDPKVYQEVEIYISRVQNLEEGNDALEPLKRAVRSEDRGGFAYRTEESKANDGKPIVLEDGRKVYPSYGSMTYVGLLSFIHARVTRDDPRVQAAWGWASRHYTLEENPGMAVPNKPAKGQEGLYYYYHTLAKAAYHFGESIMVDAKGRTHDWARELGDKLVATQQPNGTWINPADRWYEGHAALVTGYEIVALDYCLKALERRK